MREAGFAAYEEFINKAPLLVVEWHDDETEAVGWLVINSLRNGAAGGGTCMRKGGSKDESLFLAKTMEIKFNVSGPPIGGAKSVIDLDSHDPRREDVLRRWFQYIGPYLHHCYGTGGDLGVDEVRDVIPLTSKHLGLRHPQEGIVRGYIKTNEGGYCKILHQLKEGIEMPVPLDDLGGKTLTVAHMVTGYGVTRAIHHFFDLKGDSLEGKRIVLEGFGVVGGAAAYYLSKAGAKVVGILTLGSACGNSRERRCAVNKNGLDVSDLLMKRDGPHLSPEYRVGEDSLEFWDAEADIFVAAAASRTVGVSTLEKLSSNGVKVFVGGANNPCADKTLHAIEVQQTADRAFSVIPDFIANCGMARSFAYLMDDRPSIDSMSIFEDVDHTIQQAMQKLAGGYDCNTGLLNRAYSLYVK